MHIIPKPALLFSTIKALINNLQVFFPKKKEIKRVSVIRTILAILYMQFRPQKCLSLTLHKLWFYFEAKCLPDNKTQKWGVPARRLLLTLKLFGSLINLPSKKLKELE